MDTNLQIKLEEKYEELYPMTELMTFERIHPKKQSIMKVNYLILGIDFIIKVNKPKEYVALLVMTNKSRSDERVEALVLESNGITLEGDEDLRQFDFAGIIGQEATKLHMGGDLWLEGEPKPNKKQNQGAGFLGGIKSLFR